MLKKILPVLAGIPHKRYCEPFGGGATVLLAKPPVEIETYNDLDSGLYSFFMCLSDPDLFPLFEQRVKYLLYSRELYNDCRATWEQESDMVKRAVKFFVVARQSFSGEIGGGWSFVVTESSRGMAQTASKWESIKAQLPEIHKRLLRVQIENYPFERVIKTYDTPDTLFYCDPPYVHSTRKDKRYAHEMSDEQHEQLIDMLLGIKGHAVVSGYPNEIYDKLTQNDWVYQTFNTACHAAGRTRATGLQGEGVALEKQQRTEALWISPHSMLQQRLF